MENYIGMIKLFAGSYAPRDWVLCNGQLLAVSQNRALFSLIGNIYGGDGVNTFALPDLRGRVPIGASKGYNQNGLTPRKIGEVGGENNHQLNESEMPYHAHHFQVSGQQATQNKPNADSSLAAPNKSVGRTSIPTKGYTGSNTDLVKLGQSTVWDTGMDYSHNNIQPSLGMNYVICVNGIYPKSDE